VEGLGSLCLQHAVWLCGNARMLQAHNMLTLQEWLVCFCCVLACERVLGETAMQVKADKHNVCLHVSVLRPPVLHAVMPPCVT
jgi:hypothetical protein